MGEERPDMWGGLRARLGTVRVRTTAAAVIVVGVALAGAAVAMVVLLRQALTADVRSAALLRAREVAGELAATGPHALRLGEDDDEFVQVFDAEGRVVVSTPNLARSPAVARLRPGDTERVTGLPFEDDPFLAVAVAASSSRGRVTVMAGRTLDTVEESTSAVAGLLEAGVPLLLLVVGAVAWRVVGRALAPVDAMRAQVEAISTRELHRRVPTPSGTDEIGRLASMMNRMLARLEAGHARQRRFVSDASHELRSPVTTIRQHAEVALSHPDTTSLKELAELVLEEDARLEGLVQNLLLLTKLDEGSLQTRTDPVDLDDLLFEEAERMRGSTALRVDTTEVSAGRVSGDAGQLSRLVRNLTDNAARHAGSTVALGLRETNGRVLLTVDDDGEGIASTERERIFERFVRLEEARDRDSGGTGLGLAIVAEVAAGHGATVAAMESPAGGARLEVCFPARPG